MPVTMRPPSAGLRTDDDKELNEVKHHVAPDEVLDRMEAEAEPGH
jgi:hypothetical protein